MNPPGARTQCFRRPHDGVVVPLVVQHFENLDANEARHWERIGEPVSELSLLAALSSWVWSSQDTRQHTTHNLQFMAACRMMGRAIVAAPLVSMLMISLFAGANPWFGVGNSSTSFKKMKTAAREQFYNGEDQDWSTTAAIPYSDSVALGPQHSSASVINTSDMDSVSLRPRFLCFLNEKLPSGYETRNVSQYLRQHGDHSDTEFIFVSYTRLQFRVATREELERYPYDDERVRDANIEVATKDRQALIQWGIDAAKAAGKKAFWLDFECVRDADGVARSNSSSDDVYRICDVVRAAHSMIIAIGPSVEDRIDLVLSAATSTNFDADQNETKWLRQWGSRLWTLPELLLCPNEYRIKLLTFDGERRAMAKRNFAERAWEDAESVKVLVDHFEGSAILSQVQFLEAALECFARRKTSPYSPGDIAYSIMGLFAEQQRPPVQQTDSGFQAFARLVLLNDCGFLERLLCVQPPSWDRPWYDAQDVWSAKLRDFTPKCHVLDVVNDLPDTLLLNRAKAAYIQWDRLCPVPHDITSSGRNFVKLRQGLFAVTMICLLPIYFAYTSVVAPGAMYSDSFLGPTFVAVWCVAWLVAIIAGSYLLFRDAQTAKHHAPMLFGVEGTADAAQVERYLFGFSTGRFSMAPGTGGATVPIPSSTERLFSLIDTKSLTVTQIRARNPPTALFVCGEEKGMQRGLLCSYDWVTATYHREAIVRLPGEVMLEGMKQTESVRISLVPLSTSAEQASLEEASSVQPAWQSARTNGQPRPRFGQAVSVWAVDLGLLPILVYHYNMSGGNMILFDRSTAFILGMFCLWFGMCLAQVLVYFVLRHINARDLVHTALIMTVLLNFSLLLFPTFSTIILGGTYVAYAYPLEIAAGVAYGMLSHIFIILSWCWYTPRQLTARLFLILIISNVIAGKFDIISLQRSLSTNPSSGDILAIVLKAVLLLASSIFALYRVLRMALPLDVRKDGFPVHEQLETTRIAAVRTEKVRGLDLGLDSNKMNDRIRLPEKMIRALLIFALTFAVAAPVIIIDADTSVDTVEVARTILVIFPGGLISALLYWRHHLSVFATAWCAGPVVLGTVLLSLLDVTPPQYSMKILLWIVLGLEANDLDTAKMSLSASMVGHYCAWILQLLILWRWSMVWASKTGIQIGLMSAQVLLWIGLALVFYWRQRRRAAGTPVHLPSTP